MLAIQSLQQQGHRPPHQQYHRYHWNERYAFYANLRILTFMALTVYSNKNRKEEENQDEEDDVEPPPPINPAIIPDNVDYPLPKQYSMYK